MNKHNQREASRKRRRKQENKRLLQLLKQAMYEDKTGKRVVHTRLHWHHEEPKRKRYKVSSLYNRSLPTILREVAKCTVLREDEHRRLHEQASPVGQR